MTDIDRIKTDYDTVRLAGIPLIWLTPSASRARRLVIWLPGFGGNKEAMLPYLRDLAALGFVALSYDPVGHGERLMESIDALRARMAGNIRRHFWPILANTAEEDGGKMESMGNRRLAIGVVGAGALGAKHANTVAHYGARIVAVHDVRLDAAQRLADSHSASIATDELERFFDVPMDGLILATPPPVRFEPISIACAKSIHLYIEKPPALTLADARRCLVEIERAGVMSALGFQLRYDPRYERLKELIHGQTIDLVRTVCTIGYYLDFKMTPWFLQKAISGGPIAEQAIHLLDCTRFILGNPRAVRATALGMKNMALQHTEFDAESVMQMMYELDNGVLATHMNHCGHERFHFDLEVVGPHIRLHANVTEPIIRGYINGEEFTERIPEQNSLGLNVCEAWLRAIETDDRALIRSDYAESLHTMALVDAAITGQGAGGFQSVDAYR